jgi:two-component system phosphate regulon sensor histidine kinase PhoR
MDALILGFIVALLVLLAGALALAWDRGGRLDRIRRLVGARDDQIESTVRDLQSALTALDARTRQLAADIGNLADLTGAGVVRLDDDSRVEYANLVAHLYLDRSPGTMVGQTAIEAFIDRRLEEVADTARTSGYGRGELTLRESDGPTFVVRARRSPVGGVWVVIEDVTELRLLQRIRTEFIENLSHELRTPLSTVSLLAETLAREADQAATSGRALPERMRDRISKIEVETGHLVQMVNELLDLTRIERGGPMPLLHDVDLTRVARTAADRLGLFAERQGVELTVVAPESVPLIRGDEERIGQVLINLVHNAVKFSPEGGPVVIRVRQDRDEVVTSVEDRGIGIPKAAQSRIFERFYKVDRARVRGGGTGLGLSIARHVVAGHGGRIWVESDDGAGSKFSFSLPIYDPNAEPRREPIEA